MGDTMPPPPPPQTMAPSVGMRNEHATITNFLNRSTATTEDDISFLPDEITRLHRDMADMLEATSPLAGHGPSSSGVYTRAKSEKIPRKLSDSEDDYTDDPALGELRDDLRSTTERFFMRRRPPRQSRRASELAPETAAMIGRKYNASTAHMSLNLSLRHQNSCNGLSEWEKSVGTSMSRSISKSTSCSPEQGLGLRSSDRHEHELGRIGRRPTLVGPDPFLLRNLAGSAHLDDTVNDDDGIDRNGTSAGISDVDEDDASRVSTATDQSVSVGPTRLYRELFTPSSGDSLYTPSVADTGTPPLTGTRGAGGGAAEIGVVAGEVETPRSRDALLKAVLADLRARSEDAGRILEALKVVLVDDAMADSVAAMKDAAPHSRVHVEKLWQMASRENSEDNSGSKRRSSSGSAGSGSDKRMPLLLLAMDHMEQITTQVSQLLIQDGRRASAPSPSAMGYHSGGTAGHQHWQRRRPPTSAYLLRRRRSAKGQVEPISCGVPRYRIQVGRVVDDVYFEVAITQARSMWTVERRLDEFYELRRSLVATAGEQVAAKSDAAAGKRQRGSSGDVFPARNTAGEKGQDKGYDLLHAEGEARVPRITVGRSSWLENSSLGLMMSGRKREEMLAERQVLLASWLAQVLADPELMSADLVHFLGGAGAGVLPQPILEETIHEANESDTADSQSDFTEFDESGEWTNSGSGDVAMNDGSEGGPANEGTERMRRGSNEKNVRVEQATRRRASFGRASQPLRPQLVPAFSHSLSQESPGSEAAVDSRGGAGARKGKSWRLGDDEEEGDRDRSAMLVAPVSPTLSLRESSRDHNGPPSPSSPLSTPPRQISVDAFFRAPT